MLSGVEGAMNPEGWDELWLSGVEGGHGGMNPEGRDELPPVDATTDGEAMAQGSFGDPLLVGDLSPMARHRPLAQCSMGHKDDGQVDAPRRKHRLYSQTCLECQRNNDAVKMLLKDNTKIKRPISASLLFSRDFKNTAMENNYKRLSYKAAPPEARSAWEKLSEQEKEPYIKEYRRRYVEWKKSSVMAPQLDGTPPQVYTTPGQMYKQLHPELTKVVEISKAAAEEWSALDDAGRAPFFAEYDKLMDAFMQNKYPTNNRRISRRAGSAGFLQQSNEVARDTAKNAPGFAYGKDKKVLPNQVNNNVDHATVTDSVALREQILELECKLGQSDSEVADLKQRIDELLVRNEELERKLAKQHESDSEVADLKERIDELLVRNEELERKLAQQQESDSEIDEILVQNELMFKESVRQKLDHLAEELLDFDEKNAQQHRILRSLDSANKQVPSSLLAAAGSSVIRQLHPAASTRKTAHAAAGSSVIRQLEPAESTRKTAHATAASSVIRQLQTAASTRKTKGWVY